jgi:hypothetical protein
MKIRPTIDVVLLIDLIHCTVAVVGREAVAQTNFRGVQFSDHEK